jgi:hypothetical protein
MKLTNICAQRQNHVEYQEKVAPVGKEVSVETSLADCLIWNFRPPEL